MYVGRSKIVTKRQLDLSGRSGGEYAAEAASLVHNGLRQCEIHPIQRVESLRLNGKSAGLANVKPPNQRKIE
jgi:hypothetical protein